LVFPVSARQTNALKTKNKGNAAAGWYRLRNGKPGIDRSALSNSPSSPCPPARPPRQRTNSVPAAASLPSPRMLLSNQKMERLAKKPAAPSRTINAVDAEAPESLAKTEMTEAGTNWIEKVDSGIGDCGVLSFAA